MEAGEGTKRQQEQQEQQKQDEQNEQNEKVDPVPKKKQRVDPVPASAAAAVGAAVEVGAAVAIAVGAPSAPSGSVTKILEAALPALSAEQVPTTAAPKPENSEGLNKNKSSDKDSGDVASALAELKTQGS